MERIVGPIRLIVGFTLMTIYTPVWFLAMVPLLPWRVARIKACNYWGKVTGSLVMKLSGCPLSIQGREHLDPERPALYVSNHTSILDLFLGMWISPVGTVGVAKKQVVYYPLLGQLYLLSGHLRIDRGNTHKAVASLLHLGEIVRKHRLSIWMWPEGTRSNDGRLLPFKKGIVHMALQTGLPVVPVVVMGAQDAWEKGTIRVKKVSITVRALPPVDTSGWELSRMEEHLAELHRIFVEALPPDQQPAELARV